MNYKWPGQDPAIFINTVLTCFIRKPLLCSLSLHFTATFPITNYINLKNGS